MTSASTSAPPIESLAVSSVPVEDVAPHPRNVREGDVGAISVSLEQFGQYRPIVVQRQTPDGQPRMLILAGSHTWMAAKAIARESIDAVLIDVDDVTALRIMLADNRTHDLGRDRADDLATLLAELDAAVGLLGTGFDGDDLDALIRRTAPPESFADVTAPDVDYKCPSCGYGWTGEPK